MSGNKGRRYEHTVRAEINDATPDTVHAWTAGYSGNGAVASPDVIVVRNGRDVGLELKKTSQDRFTIKREDISQLGELSTDALYIGLVVKFSHRQPIVARVPSFVTATTAATETAYAAPDEVTMSATDRGNLVIEKPDLDAWSSASAGDSAGKLVAAEFGLGGTPIEPASENPVV
jgi:Holliday junction resolvase